MSGTDALHAHLKTGLTTVCRAWLLERQDGTRFGFTDHDLPLSFEGMSFDANGGLTAGAVVQTTGLSVDNTEALGALTDDRITDADITAGLYDGALVTAWLVNWTDVAERKVLFAGTIGEITRRDGRFEAELRGLTEALNQPQGRSYLKTCSAVFGDQTCKVDALGAAFSVQVPIAEMRDRKTFGFENLAFDPEWFERGRLDVVTGAGAGLTGVIRSDAISENQRVIGLVEPIRASVAAGDTVRLIAGCDKRSSTCAEKFSNILNFRGFPFIPGDDWITTVPRKSGKNNGGRLV
ncbi:DUF2163 domain-containing protein [Shimia ponticola]|uniref:DUF2163 domain-containing protein n=1 Tax=Shimia ponticola TaxID=2582893 RepID=UPI0011BF480F|nr:DUF2163 domain-containing protein [Shimia ponticola]